MTKVGRRRYCCLEHGLKSDANLLSDFRKDQEPVLRRRVGVILLLGVISVPLFGFADYFVYRDHLSEFMSYRLIASMCCLILYLINRSKNLGVRSFYLGVAAFYVVGLCIVKMIVTTGGYGTPYYAGLNLVFLGFCVVLTQNPPFLILHCSFLYAIYLISVLLFNERRDAQLLLTNNMFIACTLCIVFIASMVDYKLRWKEYLARKESELLQKKLERYSKKLENNVVESEEKYRLVVEWANDAIFVLQDNVMKFPNPKTELLLGYSVDELSRIAFSDLVVTEDRRSVALKYGLVERENKSIAITSFRIINKAGDRIWVDMSCVPVEWKGSPAVLHFVRDITERKSMEVELIHAQKMEALGMLTGGIAHDFNNILQAIIGYLEILLIKKNSDDPEYQHLTQIHQSAEQAAKLIRQLMIYSRGLESELQTIDLNQQIAQIFALLERVLPRMINIDLRLAEDVEKIKADPVQLEQIIMNLAVNARDAMPDGGRLVIETKDVGNECEFPEPDGDADPGYVLLRVSDTGHGMDEKTLGRIFDPYYTTKKPGEGTGLGLATVYALVKSHGGSITCTSEPGNGTAFQILFPVASADSSVDEVGIVQEGDYEGNQETILLVDDEKDILNVGMDMLAKHNYKVLIAENGERAIEVFEENRESIALIVMDLNMPGMGGYQCLKRILLIDPGARIVVTSGYLGSQWDKGVASFEVSSVLQKPFRYVELLKTIKENLPQ